MAIESVVALLLVTVFLGGLTWYVSNHRTEDGNNHRAGEKHQNGVTHA